MSNKIELFNIDRFAKGYRHIVSADGGDIFNTDERKGGLNGFGIFSLFANVVALIVFGANDDPNMYQDHFSLVALTCWVLIIGWFVISLLFDVIVQFVTDKKYELHSSLFFVPSGYLFLVFLYVNAIGTLSWYLMVNELGWFSITALSVLAFLGLLFLSRAVFRLSEKVNKAEESNG